MERILIAGATGSTGKRVIEILNNSQSFEPVAMIRKPEQQAVFNDMEVESVIADLEQDDFSGVLKNIDKIIFAAGSGSKTGPEKTTAVDEQGAIKLIDAAKKFKIKKFIMLSAMNADEPPEGHPLEHYLEAKAKADKHLQRSGVRYTIIRPGRLTDDLGLGRVQLAEKLDETGEISRDDVAFLLIMSLADPLVLNKTFEAIEGEKPIKAAMIDISRE